MSGSNQEVRNQPGYPDWQSAALGGNLLSYAWENRPSLGQIVPGYREDEPGYLKVLDYLSVPARVMAGPLLQGGEAFQRWMAGEQGPDVRQQITESMLGIGARGLGIEAPGPASFAAWHGSRHLFEGTPESPLGEFRDEAIGTGEGAQAYGHGHYVAGARGTAESYQRAGLDDYAGVGTYKIDGVSVRPYAYTHDPGDMPVFHALDFLAEKNGDHDAAIKELHTQARTSYKLSQRPVSDWGPEGVPDEAKREMLQQALDYSKASRWLRDNKDRVSFTPASEGHLYRVSVRPDEHELLDWDKPLAGQSPQVQKVLNDHGMIPLGERTGEPIQPYTTEHYDSAAAAFKNAGISLDKTYGRGSVPDTLSLREWGGQRAIDPNSLAPGLKNIWDHLNDANEFRDYMGPKKVNGGAIYQELSRFSGPEEASKYMHNAGIPGVKYRDAGSRDLPEGHPDVTHNYVIFHPSNLKITDRDGQQYGLQPVDHDPWAQQ